MPSILQRAVVPIVLILAGILAAIYGVAWRQVPVLEDHQSEISVDVPVLSPPDQPEMESMQGPPQFLKKTVVETKEETIFLADPVLIRDATFGGIVFNEDKQTLKRTYSGKPPSLCPT